MGAGPRVTGPMLGGLVVVGCGVLYLVVWLLDVGGVL